MKRTCSTLLAVLVAAAAGCASTPYRPGSFELGSTAFEGTYAELGCLDVAVTATTPPRGADAALVLTYGNRCEDVVTVDLESMHPRGLDVRGHDVPLRFVEDLPALRPLDRRLAGREILALRRDDGARPDGDLSTICVELGALEQRPARSDRICVATPDDRQR